MDKKFTISKLFVFMMLVVALTIQVQASEPAILISLLNQDPDPANAGDVVEVRLSVENVGADATKDLLVELTPSYPFELVTSSEAIQNVGTLSGTINDANAKVIKYTLRVDKDATAGSYDLDITYIFNGEFSKSTKTVTLDVGNSEDAEITNINQVTLVPGQLTPLIFTIDNVGSAPLKDLTFQWENEADIVLPVGSDNTKYIKYIDVGKQVNVSFDVIASAIAEPDLYKLDLSLSYDNYITGTTVTKTTRAGIYVGGETDFEISVADSSSGETSFTVANVGSNPAYSVSINVPEQNDWQVTGSQSSIIGNLNTGDYTIASFTLAKSSSRMSPTTNTDDATIPTRNSDVMGTSSTVLINVVYTDTLGKRNVVEMEVPITSKLTAVEGTERAAGTYGMRGNRQQQSNFFQQYGWQIALTVVVIMCGVFVFKFKKYKQMNPKGTVRRFIKLTMKKKGEQ